jgi:hypothetical protein
MNIQGSLDKGTQLQKVMESPTVEKSAARGGEKLPLSPLGWNIGGRLLCAAAASALLWLAVAWAMGWLS